MKKSFMAFLFILTFGHSVECFNDTCNYDVPANNWLSLAQYLCGNVCLTNYQLCDCGGQNITEGWDNDIYCCAPASACTRTQTGAKCSSGKVLSLDSPAPCNATGRCFNDVLTSQHLSTDAKYQCQGQDKCIRWYDMGRRACHGVNICSGDEELCGPELRCPSGTTRHNMSTIPVRYYCYDDDNLNIIKNNGSYELLDRTDEDLSVSTIGRSINYTALAPCTHWEGDAGVWCGSSCWHTALWCNDKLEKYCEDSWVRTTDPRLCSHPTLWQEISCNKTSGGQLYPGVRCTGGIKHCYFP